MAEALKKRRQREANKQADAIDLAPESDTPLARARLGLQPQADDVTARFATRHDGAPLVDYSEGYTGIAGLTERVESPYGVQARIRAQTDARDNLDDVVDFSQGSGYVPPAQRARSRRERLLRRLTNAERRDATVREAKLRYMEAAEDGELLEDPNETIDWSWITAEQGRTAEDWDREQKRRRGIADAADQRPGWRVTFLGAGHISGYGDNVSVDAPEGFR
jgi:hypothetical protein